MQLALHSPTRSRRSRTSTSSTTSTTTTAAVSRSGTSTGTGCPISTSRRTLAPTSSIAIRGTISSRTSPTRPASLIRTAGRRASRWRTSTETGRSTSTSRVSTTSRCTGTTCSTSITATERSPIAPRSTGWSTSAIPRRRCSSITTGTAISTCTCSIIRRIRSAQSGSSRSGAQRAAARAIACSGTMAITSPTSPTRPACTMESTATGSASSRAISTTMDARTSMSPTIFRETTTSISTTATGHSPSR